jgi:hypothetical protein
MSRLIVFTILYTYMHTNHRCLHTYRNVCGEIREFVTLTAHAYDLTALGQCRFVVQEEARFTVS